MELSKKKIYVSIVIVIIAIIGMVYYTNYQNQQLEKQAVRAVYPVDKQAIYNGLLLANTKGDPSRYNTYLYFPNENQLLDNIPQCVEPTKAQAGEFLKAYSKVYAYILKQNLIKSNNPQEIGKYTKQVLDFIYNYQSFEYFRDLYTVPEVGMWFNVSRSIGGTTLAEYEEYYKTDKHDKLLQITGVTPEQIANAVFTKLEQKELAKAEGQLLTQVSENCVQAGYGTDFYSIWWAGLPSQGVLEANSQVMMMYDIFYKGYIITEAYFNMSKSDRQRLKGKVWQILHSHEDFINKVLHQENLSAEDESNIFNVLTAEILQDDFNNENYSLALRDYLVVKLLTIKRFNNEKLLRPISNKEYFYPQKIGALSLSYKENIKAGDIAKKLCEKIKKDSLYWNTYVDEGNKLVKLSVVFDLGILDACKFGDSEYIHDSYLKNLKFYNI